MSFWRQTREIARADLIVERRAGETLRVVLPFSIAALIVFPLALDLRLELVSEIGIGVFWALAILFGMQVALRQTANDNPERRDLLALAGVDPAARFVGRVVSGATLMTAFMVVLLVATVIFFDPEVPRGSWPLMLVSVVVVAVGLTELGTLAGEVTSGLRSRSALASLIVAPLSLPLVIGATETVRAVDRETSILPWILLLIATDLALAVAGVALAKPLEEATR